MHIDNFILREQFRVLQPVGFSLQGETFCMMQDPVQHGGCQDRVSHHLSPFSDLLVRRKDDRVRFVGITDEGMHYHRHYRHHRHQTVPHMPTHIKEVNDMAFKLTRAEDFFYEPMAHEKSDMIVEDLIPKGLTILAGAPKSCKSWMALDLSLAVSSGRTFLGKNTKACGVIYFAFEDGESRFRRRALDLARRICQMGDTERF